MTSQRATNKTTGRTRHCLLRLVLGQTVENRRTGRRMEFLAVEDYGDGPLLRLRPAKGDPERTQWVRGETAVLWPRSWVWLPGDQVEFHFENKN